MNANEARMNANEAREKAKQVRWQGLLDRIEQRVNGGYTELTEESENIREFTNDLVKKGYRVSIGPEWEYENAPDSQILYAPTLTIAW